MVNTDMKFKQPKVNMIGRPYDLIGPPHQYTDSDGSHVFGFVTVEGGLFKFFSQKHKLSGYYYPPKKSERKLAIEISTTLETVKHDSILQHYLNYTKYKIVKYVNKSEKEGEDN